MIATIMADLVEMAGKAGTLSMQALMLLAIMILGSGMVWMHMDNRKLLVTFIKRMDEKDEAFTQERTKRIEKLMQMIHEETLAKADIAHALQTNAEAITSLKAFIREGK